MVKKRVEITYLAGQAEGIERSAKFLVRPGASGDRKVARRKMERVSPQRPPPGAGEWLQEREHLHGIDFITLLERERRQKHEQKNASSRKIISL